MTAPTNVTFTTGTTITSEWLNGVNDYVNELDPADHSAANVEYQPAGTGAVVTTVQSKLRETVSVKDFGAVGDGVTDDQTAFDNATTYCSANAVSLFVPSGNYKHSDIITINGFSLIGEGNTSILHATDPANSCILVQGIGSQVQNLFLTSDATVVISNGNAAAVQVLSANKFLVENVTVDKSAQMGIICLGSSDGIITKNHVYGAMRDGIHLSNNNTAGSVNIVVSNNVIGANGDDGISVVTYTTASQSNTISIVGNNIANCASRAINVAGGTNISISGNSITNSTYAGICIAQDSGIGSRGCDNITIVGNTINTSGSNSPDLYGGIHLASTTSGQTVNSIEIIGNNVNQSRNSGIVSYGNEVFGIYIDNNQILSSGQDAINITNGYDFFIENNAIISTVGRGVSTGGDLGNIVIRGNYLENIGSNNATSAVINLDSTSLFYAEVSLNTHSNRAGYTLGRFLISTAVTTTTFGNELDSSYSNPNFVSSYGSFNAHSFKQSETNVTWTSGTGSPEGVVTAPVGSLYSNISGSTSTTLYVKTSGSGNTGWTAK